MYPQLNNDPLFKHVDNIYTDRLRQFIDQGEYRQFNLPKFYEKFDIDHGKDESNLDSGYLELLYFSVPNLEHPTFHELIPKLGKEDWRKTRKGESFGPSWSTHWFKVSARVPKDWLNEEQVVFNWDCGNEGLIYTLDGEPQQAFTGGERTEFILPKSWYASGKEFKFYVEVSCNGMFGVGNGSVINPPDPNRYFRLERCNLVVPDLKARALHIDFWEIGDSAREFPGDSWQKHRARQVANEIMNSFDPNDRESVSKGLEIAAKYVGKDAHSEKVYEDSSNPEVFAIGNCHIDTAWLWPFWQTRKKVIRSWTTQVRLLEKYPEYVFAASQMQQFHWLKKDSPEAFEQIREKIKEGRFIPVGGSWVENDTNMPGGESLARQFLKGQLFLHQNFDMITDTFWLPDTFGYSSQIPQLCRLSGMSNFLTQKLSWNNINSFPLTTFNWVALDGSQVLTHMPPDNTYTADANWGDVRRSATQHKNMSYDSKGLILYGHGDGGGGPDPDQIEKLRRCRGIHNTVGGLPKLQSGNSVSDFYKAVLRDTENGKKLPAWNGELYFEFHRGTYTSQAKMKKFMRWAESNLHDLEYLATLASIFKPESFKYPARKIAAFWEDVLLCQFHDVLPGSCIEIVYKDARPMLSKVINETYGLIRDTLKVLGVKSAKNCLDYRDFVNGEFSMLDTLGFERSAVIEFPKSASLLSEADFAKYGTKMYEKASYVQKGLRNDYVFVSNTKSGNNHVLEPVTRKIKNPVSLVESKDSFILENKQLRATISRKTGVIVSLFDKRVEREVLDTKTGANTTGANQFVLLDDTPLGWQAWDTELFSLEKIHPLQATSVTKYEAGPLKSSVKVVIEIPGKNTAPEKSTIVSIISLQGNDSDDDLTFVEVQNKVDWHENCRYLKVEFPVDVHNEYASYETQFGVTKRPTHYNTSWDVAKFEVCHHRFADYSENGYGVSIINDSKFGFSTHGNLMRLSLLRAPKAPDAHADIGVHYMKYAIYPHSGTLDSKTVKLAQQFNSRFGNGMYEMVKVQDSIGKDTFELEETGFGNLEVLGKVDEFSEGLFDFIGLKKSSSLVLSNVKRYEFDLDTFVNYAQDLAGDKEMCLKQKKWAQDVKEVDTKTKSIVLRVYEALGGRGRGVLEIKKLLKLKKVFKVDNLERDVEELKFSEDECCYYVGIELRGFEAAGFRLEF